MMKFGHNDKSKMKNNDVASRSDQHGHQQPPVKVGILARFLNWIAKGATNSCPT